MKEDQSKKERTRIAQEREEEVEKEEEDQEEEQEQKGSLVTWYSIWHSVLSCRGRLGREVRIVL